MNMLLENTSTMEFVKIIFPYIRYTCYIVFALFALYVIYKRIANKIITYQEIIEWAKVVCVSGDICHISRISVIPEKVQKQIHKELGMQQIINGYKYDESVFVTITDSENNIKDTCYFMGKQLDKDLANALAVEIEHCITF